MPMTYRNLGNGDYVESLYVSLYFLFWTKGAVTVFQDDLFKIGLYEKTLTFYTFLVTFNSLEKLSLIKILAFCKSSPEKAISL